MSKWISVKERLPEQLKEVIVYSHSPYDSGSYDISVWVLDHGGYWMKPREIPSNFVATHWMPLPDPPESVRKVSAKLSDE